MTDEVGWRQALARLSWEGDSKPLADLLRTEQAPLKVQEEIAELLDPRDPDPILRLKIEIDRRELGKMGTLAKKIVEGHKVDLAGGRHGKIDAAVEAVRAETGKSRAHLHKAHNEATKFRTLIRIALISLSKGNPDFLKKFQEQLTREPDAAGSTILGEIRRLYLQGEFKD